MYQIEVVHVAAIILDSQTFLDHVVHVGQVEDRDPIDTPSIPDILDHGAVAGKVEAVVPKDHGFFRPVIGNAAKNHAVALTEAAHGTKFRE